MENVSEDFSRLHGTAAGAAEGFNPTKTHPVFGAVHSMILAHRYGKADPHTYMNNPGLRAMDTREAAFQGLQRLPQGIRSVRSLFSRSGPQSPGGPVAGPGAPAWTGPTARLTPNLQAPPPAAPGPGAPAWTRPTARPPVLKPAGPPPSNWIG
jgi:hypothetical protein